MRKLGIGLAIVALLVLGYHRFVRKDVGRGPVCHSALPWVADACH